MAKRLLLTGVFVLLIFGVGLTQAGIELARGDTPQFLDLFRRAPSEAHLRDFEEDLEDASWFAERLRPWMQYAQFAVLRDAGEYGLLGRDGWLFYRPGAEYLVEPWAPDSEDGDSVSAIVSFRDQLAALGIELLVVPAPGKASVYPDRLTRRAPAALPYVNVHTRTLMARLADARVEVVDLQAVYAQASAADSTLYLAQDTHWTPAGMRLAAQAVARRLLELGWVEPGSVPYVLEPVELQRHGDIVRMMQMAPLEERLAPEPIACARVVRRDTREPYQDDPSAPVLVLGDSFLRIYQRDEPGSAGFIAHLAHELSLPLASIVNDGGASTLVRQELSRRPKLLANKRVVVWEFVERDIRFGTEGWQDIRLRKPPPSPST